MYLECGRYAQKVTIIKIRVAKAVLIEEFYVKNTLRMIFLRFSFFVPKKNSIFAAGLL